MLNDRTNKCTNGNWLKWMHLNGRKDVVGRFFFEDKDMTCFPSNNDVNSMKMAH